MVFNPVPRKVAERAGGHPPSLQETASGFESRCRGATCEMRPPPITSAGKTRPLMAGARLRGGLLHTAVLQDQHQIYKSTIKGAKSMEMPLKWNKLPILLMWLRLL